MLKWLEHKVDRLEAAAFGGNPGGMVIRWEDGTVIARLPGGGGKGCRPGANEANRADRD